MHRTDRPAFSVGILAGGKSTRMGQNKALMEFQNETMIGRISRTFSGAGEVLVSASQPGIYEAEGLRVVYDENRDIGPIEGIRRLISCAEEEYVFICAADMPFVTRDIAEYLAEFISSDHDCYVIEDEEHVHPLCAIYSKRILPVIEELIREGRYRLLDILNRVRTKYISLAHTDFDRRILRNVNTKDEFKALSLPAVFAVSGYKNTGKTWLIEKLINEFKQAGYSVGILKHSGHDHIGELPGTDTWRFREAGSVCSIVFSASGYVISGSFPARSVQDGQEEGFIAELKAQPASPDVIILEGFKHSPYPKVEIIRESVYPESAADPSTLICIATDTIIPEEMSCPVYAPDDVEGIFLCLKTYFGL